MPKKSAKMLTTGEVADRLGAAESSVRFWARTGRFPGATRVETPVGSYWMIPASAMSGFQMKKPGPKPKATKLTND